MPLCVAFSSSTHVARNVTLCVFLPFLSVPAKLLSLYTKYNLSVSLLAICISSRYHAAFPQPFQPANPPLQLLLLPSLLALALTTALPTLSPRNGPTATVTDPVALTYYQPDLTRGTPGYSVPNTYQCFSGPSSTFVQKIPFRNWMSFDAMFARNKQYSLLPVGDTPAEATAIHDAIVAVAQKSKVDARVILAVVIQETTGNVRAPCTNNGVQNCGLMQSYNPADTAYDPKNMQASITQMVVDGTQGTAAGPGLVQLFNGQGVKTMGSVWTVLRAYNSGCVNFKDLSDGTTATASYVSDVANRLLGWNGYGDGGGKCGFLRSGCPAV